MVTMETANNALKTFYLDAVTEALDKKANPLLAQIEQTTSDVVGKDVKKLVKLGMNGGISAGSETGELPASSSETRVTFTSTLKNLYGTIQISDKAIRASANNEGAFVNLLNDEMQGLIKSARFNFGRMLFGDGTGKIGLISNASGNVATLIDGTGLLEGLYVDFFSFDGTTALGRNFKIVSIDREANTMTVSGMKQLSDVVTGPAAV